MATQASLLQNRTWTRDGYVISTDHRQIPTADVNAMFAMSNTYWANPVPDAIMAETLQNSLCFGLFKLDGSPEASPTGKTLIGLARCITDYTTFLYLTDVFILPEHQGGGLGKWLIRCVDEVVGEMGWLRRAMLLTGDWERSVPFYEAELGMSLMGNGTRGEGVAVMVRSGPGVVGLTIGGKKK